MIETFCCSKSIRTQGLVFGAFFLALILSFSGPFFADEATVQEWGYRDRRSAVRMTGVADLLFGSFLIVSIYMVAEGYIGRVSVNGSILSFRTVFRTHHFDAPAVKKLRWKSHRLEFEIPNRKVALQLHLFGKNDRLRIIRLMRALFPEGTQEGWATFCQKTALPLRDGVDSFELARLKTSGLGDEAFVFINRSRYNGFAYTLIPMSLAIALVIWWKTAVARYFALLPLMVLFFLALRYSVPRGGQHVLRITASPRNRLALAMGISIIVLTLAMVVPAVLGLRGAPAVRFLDVLAAISVLGSIVLIGATWKVERSAERATRADADSAQRRWEAGEPTSKSGRNQNGSRQRKCPQ